MDLRLPLLALLASLSPMGLLAAPPATCTADPALGAQGAAVADALCAALTRQLAAPAGIASDPVLDHLRGRDLRLEVTAASPTGFSSRLGHVAADGTMSWGPAVDSQVMDLDHIPPAAFDDAARALISLATRRTE